MKLTFIIPDSKFLINPKTFPNLGILYLSAVLKQAGHEVDVIDLTGGGELPEIEADVVGISATTPQFPEAVKILSQIKEERRSQWVIAGGPHATVDPDSSLKAGFNQVVKGEGEQAIIEVAEGNTEKIIEMPPIDNLDIIPFPDRDSIDLDSYHYYLDGARTTSMMTSRGCSFNCAFCCKTWPRQVRFRSKENVLAEARAIRDMGYDGVMMYDDELLFRKERDWGIFYGFERIGLLYRCFTRADLLDEESAQIMASTGCKEVLIGCESGSNKILKNIHKGTTREQNIRAIHLLRKYSIQAKAALIMGLPGESWDTIRETESFVEEAQPDDVDFTICTVYKGSPIADNPDAYDIKFGNSYTPYKTKPGGYSVGVSTSHMTAEEIVKARDELEKKFKRKELLR